MSVVEAPNMSHAPPPPPPMRSQPTEHTLLLDGNPSRRADPSSMSPSLSRPSSICLSTCRLQPPTGSLGRTWLNLKSHSNRTTNRFIPLDLCVDPVLCGRTSFRGHSLASPSSSVLTPQCLLSSQSVLPAGSTITSISYVPRSDDDKDR